MGLGKTYQTICRIVDGANDKDPAKEKERKEYGRTTLVVCPTSVVSQWESEIVKVAPGLRVLAHHGPKRTKDSKTLLRYDVVITSYPTILAEHNNYVPSKNEGEKTSESGDDSEEFVSAAKKVMAKKKKPVAKKHCALFENKFLRIVLDEAHTIKNRSSKTTKACFALKSRYRWCLTGTPIQNSVDELWPLVHFLQVRPLDNWDTFNHQIVKPMKSGKTSVPMKRLHVVLQAIMLRRTKDQEINGQAILKLPDRHLDIITCEFDDSEQEFYDLLVAKADQQLDKIDRQAQSGIQTYSSMLLLLLRLRQACCHPALCTRNAKDDTEAIDPKAQKKGEEEDKEADEMADLFGKMTVAASFCEICRDKLEPDSKSQYCADCELQIVAKARRKSLPNNPSTKGLNELPSSAKIRKMIRILNKINKESDGAEKTIVFSQFTGFLDIIEPFLQKEGFRYIRYDGTMKTPERDAALNKFRNDERTTIALISFKAGSVGLNLTAANHVILMDMWWNPALEDQAFDRAHRLGQKRNVFIYKLMIEETVEKRIQELQEKKRELAKAALTGDKVKKMRLGMDELRMLFSHAARDDDDDAY
ncbi:hypothetical protein FRC03_002229 [Tulasnella sp. 419]|nr:hypothetical protein FRC02_010382 [Tulasnella sp. 418]KAG8964097.1 hypothetical protein FRC03_002229 [Tulasnella sp. 419]